jgi:hypothetical protein
MGTLAACAEQVLSGGPDLWFSEDPMDRRRAGDVCMDCPMKMTCPDRVPYVRPYVLPAIPKPVKPPKPVKVPKPKPVKPPKPVKVPKPVVLLCRTCAQEFPARGAHRYCGEACKAAAVRERGKAWNREHYTPTGRKPGRPRVSLDDPCPQGHVGERYRDRADEIWCRACNRERWQRWKASATSPA